MKFFSKYSNFRIILKHGIQAEPMTGRASVPGVYVKFEAGEAVVSSQEVIDMLLAHPRFGTDFVAEEADPFQKNRKQLEPEHDMVNVQFGHIGKNDNPRPGKNSEVVILAKEMAKEIVKEMLADAKREAEAKQESEVAEIKVPETPKKTVVLEEAKAVKK